MERNKNVYKKKILLSVDYLHNIRSDIGIFFLSTEKRKCKHKRKNNNFNTDTDKNGIRLYNVNIIRQGNKDNAHR